MLTLVVVMAVPSIMLIAGMHYKCLNTRGSSDRRGPWVARRREYVLIRWHIQFSKS